MLRISVQKWLTHTKPFKTRAELVSCDQTCVVYSMVCASATICLSAPVGQGINDPKLLKVDRTLTLYRVNRPV